MRLSVDVDSLKDRLDLWQQRVPFFAVPVGVWLRYREDRAYEYAALLSYYGFFSLFPLLIVFVTIIGYLTAENETLRRQIIDTVFSQIPVVGDALAGEVSALEASGLALLIAIGFTLWAGLGVVRVAQDAFNTMWSVQIMRRPAFFPKLFRSLAVLVVLGLGFIVATFVSALVTFAFDVPGVARIVGALVAISVNALVILVAFKVLNAAPTGFRDLLPGSLLGGIALWVLQLVGGLYINGVILGASAVYGTFASVIGLLVWLALVARILLLANEVNVATSKRLWPRSFEGRNLTEADRRSFSEVAEREIRRAERAAPAESGHADEA